MNREKCSLLVLFFSIFAFNLYAQSQQSSQGHQEAVSVILPTKEAPSSRRTH